MAPPTFTIRSREPTLLGELVRVAIVDRFPRASVRTAFDRGLRPVAAVRVQLADSTRWLLVGAALTETDAADAIVAGAWGVLSLESPEVDIDDALNSLVDGSQRYIPGTVSLALARAAAGRGFPSSMAGLLTPREEEVLEFLARGYRNGEIAAELGISANTVRTHVQALLSKLGVDSRGRAVVRARELGLVPAAHS